MTFPDIEFVFKPETEERIRKGPPLSYAAGRVGSPRGGFMPMTILIDGTLKAVFWMGLN